MTYYKVVYENEDTSLESPYESTLKLEYKVGEWTYPEIGKIFIVDSFSRAKMWQFGRCHIYKCDTINPIKNTIASTMVSANKLKEFWDNYERLSNLDEDDRFNEPEIMSVNGHLADAIRLTEKIHSYAL